MLCGGIQWHKQQYPIEGWTVTQDTKVGSEEKEEKMNESNKEDNSEDEEIPITAER